MAFNCDQADGAEPILLVGRNGPQERKKKKCLNYRGIASFFDFYIR